MKEIRSYFPLSQRLSLIFHFKFQIKISWSIIVPNKINSGIHVGFTYELKKDPGIFPNLENISDLLPTFPPFVGTLDVITS